MSKHTPGPWQYRPNKHDDWGFVRALPEAGETVGHIVAIAKDTSIPFEYYDDFRARKADPFEANARLIAAAPELLESLKDYVQGAYVPMAARHRAIAAIDKAEGR